MAWDKRSFTIPAGTPLIYVAGSPNSAAGIYRIDGLDGYVVIYEGNGLSNDGLSGLYSSYTGSGQSGCYGSGTNWLNFKTLGDWRPNTYFPTGAGPNHKPVRVPYSFTLPSHHPTYIKIQQQQQQQQVNDAWSSISSLSVPDVNSTTKESAQSTFNSAQSYYNAVTGADSSFTNYDNIISKYNSIKSAYDNIVARDARLTKKADKTELNTADTKARVEYTTSYTKGTEDYTALKAALAAANKRMKL